MTTDVLLLAGVLAAVVFVAILLVEGLVQRGLIVLHWSWIAALGLHLS